MTPELPLCLLAFLCLLSALPAAGAFCVARNASDSIALPDHAIPNGGDSMPFKPRLGPRRRRRQPPPASIIHDRRVANDAITLLCGKIDYPDVCLSSVRPLAGHRPIHIASSVLSLQMKACQKLVKVAKVKVDAAVVSPGTDPRTASNLQVCSDSYDDALDNLNDARIAVKAKDTGTMNSMLSALVTDFSTCEDSFSEMNVRSPQAAADNLLTKMASNCLALASLL